MATGGGEQPPGKDDGRDFRRYCSLCMEPYKGRDPKILPCFHTFCLPCLTTLQANVTIATPGSQGQVEGQGQVTEGLTTEDQGQGVEGEGQQGDAECRDDASCGGGDTVSVSGVFQCPTCRARISIPEGGVTALQTNFYLDYEDCDWTCPPPLCGMCEVTNQQQATHACDQCQLTLCATCRRCHDRCTRDHQVVAVTAGKPTKEKKEKKNYCLVHPDQVLCFHCRQCDVSICLHCKVTSHEGHTTVDMARAILQSREAVMSLVAKATEQLQVAESAMRRVERDDRDLTRYMQQVTQQLQARYDVLMTWVQQSRDRVMDDIKAKEGQVKGQLKAEVTTLTVTTDTLRSLTTRAARVAPNDPDLLTLKKELEMALHGDDGLSQLRKRAERQEAAWQWKYDVADADVLCQELVAAYMGGVVEGEGAGAFVLKPLSLRELSDRVDRWMTQVIEDTAVSKKAEDDLQAKTAALVNDVTAIKKDATDFQTKTAALVNDFAAVQNDVTAMKKESTNFQTKTAALQKAVTAMKKDETDIKNDIAIIKKAEADFQTKTTSLQIDVTAIKKDATDFQTKTTALQKDVTAMKKAEADMMAKMTSLEKDLKKNTASTKLLTTKMEKAGKMVSFHVKGCKTVTNGKPIIFNEVLVNEGGCYDNATGTFTAPVPGTYTFTASTGCAKENTCSSAYLQIDGKDCGLVRGYYFAMGSHSMSVQLSAGQKVTVKAHSSSEYFHSDELSFTGALVQPQL